MGAKLKPCKVCKNQVADDAIVCPSCGSPLPGVGPEENKKDPPELSTLAKITCIIVIYLSWKLIKYLTESGIA